MARKSRCRPSFFKVLIKDFADKLNLPPVFVQKYGSYMPENVKLRTRLGETWDVKFEEVDDENYCFTEGWNKFAEDVKLEKGEFVVFWFNTGKSNFDVSIYEISGCEREVLARNHQAEDSQINELSNDSKYMNHISFDVNEDKQLVISIPDDSDTEATESETRSGNSWEERHPRFEVVMTESRRSRVCLRKEFVEATRLIGKRAVVLEYPPGQRYWPVILNQRPRSYFGLELGAGWHDFWKENGLVMGKTYSFEFNPTKNVIQVKDTETS